MSTSQPELRLVESQPDSPDPNLGQTFDGRYYIERVLGKGGMGIVYAAKHVILQKPLAVKVLKEEVSRDEKVMARFRREAQSASAIGSPHICDVSDFGTLPDGSTYFVMEYLDGPSLASALEAQSPMPIDELIGLAIQLCDALGAAHDRGIVHRDLKPDNVHVVNQAGRNDFIKVLDFGIAKVGGAADKKLTQAGQVFGTPHYMSPEQCGGREVDHRTDIYALGVILYEMACGVVPFDADNLMGVLTKHVYENPIPPREFPPPVHVSPGLEAVILKSLAKTPEQRYQSMAEFRDDLSAVRQGGTPNAVLHAVDGHPLASTQMIGGSEISGLMGAFPATPGSQHPASMMPAESKSPTLLIVGGVLLLLVLGAGVFGLAFFLSGGDEVGTTVATEEPGGDTTPEDPIPADVTPEVAPTPEVVVPEVPAAPEVVMVNIVSEPEGAEVYAEDGSLMGNTPFELERPAAGADPVSVTLRFAGYQDRTLPISHLTSASLTIRLDRQHRRGRGRGRRTQAQAVRQAPQVRTLGGTSPPPRPPPRSSGSSEIISPW